MHVLVNTARQGPRDPGRETRSCNAIPKQNNRTVWNHSGMESHAHFKILVMMVVMVIILIALKAMMALMVLMVRLAIVHVGNCSGICVGIYIYTQREI